MEKSADEYTGQFIVLRTVYTTRVTLCTTPGIKTYAVTNQLLRGLFVWIEKLKAHFLFSCFNWNLLDEDLNNRDPVNLSTNEMWYFFSEWKDGSLVPVGEGHGDQVVVEVAADG